MPEILPREDWLHASEDEINNMTIEEAMLIVQRQIDLGHSKSNDFKPRAHMTKALELLMEQAKNSSR